jgi:putative salt-induced outer membrane protein YdiY
MKTTAGGKMHCFLCCWIRIIAAGISGSIFFTVFLSGLATSTSAYADWVEMKNGDRLSGIITGADADKLVVKTPYAGNVAVLLKEVRTFETDSPVFVSINDGTTLKGRVAPAEDGRISLQLGEIVQTVSFPLERVKAVSLKPAPPVRVAGRISAGVDVSKGNTQTQMYHMDAEAVARTAKSRYTIGGEFNYEEDEGEQTADNALAYLKYDYFLNGEWYLFNNLAMEKDKFKDIRLRSLVGAGVGYQFWEEELSNFSLELGISYVNEDFEEADDNGYASSRWAVTYDRYFLAKTIQFFHFHEGLLGVEDTRDLFIRSRTGLRFPFRTNLLASAQFHYDWDNSPAAGKRKADTRYLLTLGYSW